ncbi:MAG: molybdopterin molybdotransferase MoeA [Opitutaceae bacterium]
MKSLITPSEATRLILENLPKISTIQCPLDKCAGRILQETIIADRPFPPFNRSMMDGYAIRAADIDTDGQFHISIQAPAGSPEQLIGSTSKHCAEIMTGAVVPEDADCVVPYETTKRIDEQTMQLLKPSKHTTGDCIHPYASDRPTGEILLKHGAVIGSREIAVAATCGYAKLSVAKIPAITIVSTGDELVDVALEPAPHQIRRSNDIMVETALARVHLNAKERAHLPDEADECKTALKALIEKNEVILISGGISMGKKDFIPAVLDELGLTNHFHGIAQKPGKPMGYWTNSKCAVFTLPGNPLSTLTCLHHYVIPAIFSAMGKIRTKHAQKVSVGKDLRARDDITIFLPVSLSSDHVATSQPAQNSGDLVRILSSDGYIVVPPKQTKVYPTGSSFDYHAWH